MIFLKFKDNLATNSAELLAKLQFRQAFMVELFRNFSFYKAFWKAIVSSLGRQHKIITV